MSRAPSARRTPSASRRARTTCVPSLPSFTLRGTPVTVQGARTGLAAGAVPHGGHVMSLTRMNRYLGMRRGGGRRVLPGAWSRASCSPSSASTSRQRALRTTAGTPTRSRPSRRSKRRASSSSPRTLPRPPPAWAASSPATLRARAAIGTGPCARTSRGCAWRSPTATSSSCAGARSSPMGASLPLTTESGRELYARPADLRDAADQERLGLFRRRRHGRDRPLYRRVRHARRRSREIEVALMPAPAVVWGVSCFFASEDSALGFTDEGPPRAQPRRRRRVLRRQGALNILRRQREASTAFSALPKLSDERGGCASTSSSTARTRSEATAELYRFGRRARVRRRRRVRDVGRPYRGRPREPDLLPPRGAGEREHAHRRAPPHGPRPSPSWAATCPFPMSACATSSRCTAARLPRRGSSRRRGATSGTTTST